MESTHHIKILYGLVALLLAAVSVMAVMLYRFQSETAISRNQGATAAPDLSGIIIGGDASATTNVVGTVAEVGNGSMKVKVSGRETVAAISISADTELQIAGPFKDIETQREELAAYNAQVALLVKDPAKNKEALTAIRVPPTQTATPATLADFKAGDQVLVVASGVDTSGAYRAVFVSRSAVAQ